MNIPDKLFARKANWRKWIGEFPKGPYAKSHSAKEFRDALRTHLAASPKSRLTATEREVLRASFIQLLSDPEAKIASNGKKTKAAKLASGLPLAADIFFFPGASQIVIGATAGFWSLAEFAGWLNSKEAKYLKDARDAFEQWLLERVY